MKQPKFIHHDFWATRFYMHRWDEHETMSSNIVEYLYQDRDKQQANIASGIAPAAKSNYGIYESDFDLLDRDHSGIKSLKAFIGDALQQTVSHVNGGVVPPERIEIEFRDSWYHITNNGGFHDAHVHGGCSWCGIFYLQAGESGQLKWTPFIGPRASDS